MPVFRSPAFCKKKEVAVNAGTGERLGPIDQHTQLALATCQTTMHRQGQAATLRMLLFVGCYIRNIDPAHREYWTCRQVFSGSLTW